MENTQYNFPVFFNNILYIGDEPKACIDVMEQFNYQLLEIENHYSGWFSNNQYIKNKATPNSLQGCIKYHFEGGIAIFKFKNDDELPQFIKNECLSACKRIAEMHCC